MYVSTNLSNPDNFDLRFGRLPRSHGDNILAASARDAQGESRTRIAAIPCSGPITGGH
jgi:hypothetical protein